MNPIEILYSWQALLIAVAATGVTQLVKTVIDIVWGKRVVKKRASQPPPVPEQKSEPASPEGPYRTASPPKHRDVGKSVRKRSVIVNRLVLPMTPILVGAIMAMLVPARPEVITEYVSEHEITGWTVYLLYASWGAACGQFADYLWSKVKSTFETMKSNRNED